MTPRALLLEIVREWIAAVRETRVLVREKPE